MKRITALSCFIFLFADQAFAGNIYEAHVVGVYCGYFGNANMCSIYFDKKSNASNTCADPLEKMRMQLRVDTNVGKAMLTVALMAHSQGSIVNASGTETCSIWPDTEDLNSIFVLPSCSPVQTDTCTNLQ